MQSKLEHVFRSATQMLSSFSRRFWSSEPIGFRTALYIMFNTTSTCDSSSWSQIQDATFDDASRQSKPGFQGCGTLLRISTKENPATTVTLAAAIAATIGNETPCALASPACGCASP